MKKIYFPDFEKIFEENERKLKEDPIEFNRQLDLDSEYCKWYNSTIIDPYNEEFEKYRLSEEYKKWKIDNNYKQI